MTDLRGEIRNVADAAYGLTEEQFADDVQPYAVIDLAGNVSSHIRELVPLFTIVGETSPQMRKDSVTWGDDQNLETTFLDRFYDSYPLSETFDDNIANLFLRGKQEYISSMDDRMPDGSICLLGMIALYTYTEYTGINPETGERLTIWDWLEAEGGIKQFAYSASEEISAKLIAPRAFAAKVIEASPRLELLDWPINQPNTNSNATPAELIVLGSLPHILAPNKHLNPNIKEALFM